MAFFTSLTLHSLAMAFVVGINIAISLRLLGVAPGIPLPALSRFFRLHWTGVVIIFLSGIALLIAYPAKALTNPVFYVKFTALSAGLLIARRLELQIRLAPQQPLFRGHTRAIAAGSLALWVITISAGRFLAYTNSVLLASRFY